MERWVVFSAPSKASGRKMYLEVSVVESSVFFLRWMAAHQKTEYQKMVCDPIFLLDNVSFFMIEGYK